MNQTLCAVIAAFVSIGGCSLYIWYKERQEQKELEKKNKESKK